MKTSYIFLFFVCFSLPLCGQVVAQKVAPTNLLMLDYSVYDRFYVEKVEEIIQKHLSDVAVNHFWSGTPQQLAEELEGIDYVVIPYPSKGNETLLNEYGIQLKSFVEKGGVVLCTGTHEYTYINAYHLVDVFYGRYCLAPKVEMNSMAKLFAGNLPQQFTTQNFAYTLDIFDASFSEIATNDGKTLVGYKSIGLGAFIYIGLEYFYDEQASTTLLINALHWKQHKNIDIDVLESVVPSAVLPLSILPNAATVSIMDASALPQGTADPISYDFDFMPNTNDLPSMKVYPNPFTTYTIADIELRKTSTVTISVFNNTGQKVVTPVRNEILEPGKYKYKLSNLPEGIYYIEYNCDGEITRKKALKIVRP